MKVIFKNFEWETVAIFPELTFNGNLLTCYAKIGQHSGCSKELLNYPDAKPNEYLNLLSELIQLGYENLEVLNDGFSFS